MNIVKFRDIVLNEKNNKHDLSQDKVDYFNSHLKGKYAYCVNWLHVIALDSITEKQYVDISKTGDTGDLTFIELIDIKNFIDMEATYKVNSAEKYVLANQFTTDDDITLCEIKKFRTWLADVLLKSHPTVTYKIDEMLKYYKLEMNDETVKHLTQFAPETTVDPIMSTNTHTCGCQKTSTSGLITGVTTCNPIYEYRKAVYNQMVETFSDISFWLELEHDVLNEIKRYIDNIIKCNLPLYTSEFTSDLYDCGCLSNADSQQEKYIEILKDLSDCFEFMATENYKNKTNHIGLTLNKWASLLYERMRWY